MLHLGHLINSPILGISLTLISYQVSVSIYHKSKQFPLFNPVLLSVSSIILFLTLIHVSYEQYWQGAQIFVFFNGIVVALAIPLFRYAREIAQCYHRVIIIVLISALIAFISGVFLAKIFNLDAILTRSVAARSVTTPLAIMITDVIHGNSAFITLFAILNGITSSILLFPMLQFLKIEDESLMGLIAGISASAIGTALAFSKNYRMGCYAALGMILNGVLSAIIIPLCFAFF